MNTELALKVNKYIHEQCIDGVPHDIGWNVVKLFLIPPVMPSLPDGLDEDSNCDHNFRLGWETCWQKLTEGNGA